MITFSVCMIVRNEEAVLGRCLDAIQGVYDQLVIVDTGSEDATVSIARLYTSEVYCEPWENDFGKARNSSYSRARCDYILYLDADDVLPGEEREKLLRLKQELGAMQEARRPRTILMRYDVPEAGGISYRQRMVARRDDGRYWQGQLHECLFFEEPVLETDILFLHRKLVQPPKDRNCNIIRSIPRETLRKNFWLSAQCYLDMVLAGHEEEAEEYFAMCREAYAHGESTCLQISSTLNNHKLWAQALRWAELAESDPDAEPALTVPLLQQGVKACVGLGRLDEATEYNERVLRLAPENRAARLNRIFLEQKRQEA